MPRRTSPLKLEPKGDFKELKKLLKGNPTMFVIVFANWCGHCQTMKKNIWDPLCKRKNVNADKVAAVESSVLESAGEEGKEILEKVSGFPTLVEIKNGVPVGTKPVPESVEKMEEMVNSLDNRIATPYPITSTAFESQPQAQPEMNANAARTFTPVEDILEKESTKPMQGGSLYDTMRHISSGILPAGVLGLTALAMRGGRRIKRKTKTRAKRSKHRKAHTRRRS